MKPTKTSRSQVLMLLFGGILPVIAFAIVEDKYGVIWGTIAGMVFGVGEVVYEKLKLGKVNNITWFSNALILVLGGISLISQDGLWFKLQPAILLLTFGAIVIASSVMGKPLLVAMALKQNPDMRPEAIPFMTRLNLRFGILFIVMGAISTHAALYWSVEAWAFLKSIGVTLIMIAYLAGEFIYARLKRK